MTWVPDVEDLQLLVGVERHGSLTAAAAEAGISQPAASKRMTKLERRLGVRLLDRTRRGSALTADGELVTGWARRVLGELTILIEGAQALRRRTSAQLTVAASLTVAEHLLPGWLGELRRLNPQLRMGLQVTNSAQVCELVRGRVVDLGFIESPGVLNGLRYRAVGTDRLVLVVAPDHPWARRRRPVAAAELAQTPLISREAGSGTRDTADQALAAVGQRPVPPLLVLGSTAAICSSVQNGGGPALISELAAAADLAARTLIEVPTAGVDLSRTLRAVWHPDVRPAGPAANLVAQALAPAPDSRPAFRHGPDAEDDRVR
jgi:DNA-binding transcriptional LysR family regulator